MSLSLKRRGRHWYAVGQTDGKRVNRSLHTTDRTVAESLKRDLELQVLSHGRLSRILWSKFSEEYLQWIAPQAKPGTLARYTFLVNRFSRFLSDRVILEMQDIQPATLTEFAEVRRQDIHPTRKTPVGPTTISNNMRVLASVFAYAVRCGYLARNPVTFRGLTTQSRRKLPFTERELAVILADDVVIRSPKMRAVVLMFLFSGLRISDVIHFPLESLDLKGRRMIVPTQKRGKTVTLAIHPELATALETHLAHRSALQQSSPLLFSTRAGRPIISLDRDLGRLFKRCGIVNGHPHRFRHTFAVRLLSQGASLYDVAKMLGINARTAERHYTPYVQELQDRAARLINTLKVPTPDLDNVVQFCAPLSTTSDNFGQSQAKAGGRKKGAS
jgi:integrase/recombinase XerD